MKKKHDEGKSNVCAAHYDRHCFTSTELVATPKVSVGYHLPDVPRKLHSNTSTCSAVAAYAFLYPSAFVYSGTDAGREG